MTEERKRELVAQFHSQPYSVILELLDEISVERTRTGVLNLHIDRLNARIAQLEKLSEPVTDERNSVEPE
jgi:hypothetical protein